MKNKFSESNNSDNKLVEEGLEKAINIFDSFKNSIDDLKKLYPENTLGVVIDTDLNLIILLDQKAIGISLKRFPKDWADKCPEGIDPDWAKIGIIKTG